MPLRLYVRKYKDKYRSTPARLNGWDYGANALYFVTICTKDRVPYFGEIIEQGETQSIVSLHPTEIAEFANHNWLQIPKYSPFV